MTSRSGYKSTKRANGLGTIHQLPSGKWRWQSPPVGPDRKRVTQTFRTKTEAEAARAKGMTMFREGTLQAPSQRTTLEQLTEWFEDQRPGWAANTAANYRRIIHLHLAKSLGHIRVQHLNADHVRHAYRAIRDSPRGRGNSKTLLRTARTALVGALEMAVESGVIPRNPAEKVVLKASRDAEQRVTPHWNSDQARHFLSQVPQTNWGDVFTFALLTGLRRGEVLGLRWRNVVLEGERPRILVIDNWTKADKKQVLTTLKGKGQQRWLPIGGAALALLVRRKQSGTESGEFVFYSDAGTPLSPDNADRALAVLCRQLSLPCIPPHGLRHTYVSVQRKNGLPIEKISKQLGHATPAITLAIYSHIFDEELEDMTLSFGEELQSI